MKDKCGAAEAYAELCANCETGIRSYDKYDARMMRKSAFEAGFNYANRWIDANNEKPKSSDSPIWVKLKSGFKSYLIIIKTV